MGKDTGIKFPLLFYKGRVCDCYLTKEMYDDIIVKDMKKYGGLGGKKIYK